MNPSENKALYRRFIEEVFNQGRLDRADELLAPSYVFHDAPPGTPDGPDGVKRTVTMFRGAFPDLHIAFEEQVAEGDKVCSRTVMRGTHKGGIFGVPPSGRQVAMPGMTMVRIAGGRIVESWVRNDVLGLMTQLGAR